MSDFSNRLKELRNEKRLTQDDLASKFFLNKSSISRYETGKQVPELELLQNIAKYFNVSTDYLLGNSDIKNPYKEDNKELSEDDIITLAAHSIGHLDDLSEDEREKIRLAIKIALMNGKRTIKGE